MINVKTLGLVFSIIIGLLLSGCGTTQYLVDNNSYTSSASALDALRIKLQEIENNLQPIGSTPQGTAVVITPSQKACQAGLSIQGSLADEHVNYLLASCQEDYAHFYRFLVKSNLFTSIDHVVDDDPQQYATQVSNDYDAKIYLEIKSPRVVSWLMSVSPDDTPQPITMDKMAKNETAKIQSWLSEVESHLGGLGRIGTGEQIVLAVTDFANTTGQIKNDWLRVGISDLMSIYFSKLRGIKPVTRTALEKALPRHSSLQFTTILDEHTAPTVGQQVGADYIIIGSYQADDNQITINTRLLKTDTGEILRTEQEPGKLSDLDSVVGTLVLKIAGIMGTAVSEAEKQLLKEQGIQMMKVIEGLSKGALSRHAGDLDGARKHYKGALENDPTNEEVLERIKDIDAKSNSIALVDFKNNSKNKGFDYLSNAIPEDLTTLIFHKTALKFTERLNLKKAIEELKLGQTEIIDEKTAPQVGKLAGASQLIIGSFSVIDEKITINTRLIDTETASIIGSENADGLLKNRRELEETLVDQLIQRLREVRPVELKGPATDMEAHKAVKKAKQALQNIQSMGARKHAPERLDEIEKLMYQAEKALESKDYDEARKLAHKIGQKSEQLAILVKRKPEDAKFGNFRERLTKEEKVVELRLGESLVGFEYDSAKLKGSSFSILSGIAKILKEFVDYRVVIVGHTDSIGPDAYNQKLSERRAKSVLRYMATQGVKLERLTSIGYGEKHPLADNTTPEGRMKNRRVEFRLIR